MSTETEYRYMLDWLRYTLPSWVDVSALLPNHAAFAGVDYELRPLPYYTRAIRLVCGRIDKNDRKSEQGTLITLTGRDLHNARVLGVTTEMLVDHVLTSRAQVTRVDLAVDILGIEIDITKVWKDYQRGKISTNARRADTWHSSKENVREGVTVQIGSRSSSRVLRVYDKGAETETGELWTRIELELKGDAALSALVALRKNPLPDVIKHAVRDYADIPRRWWREALKTRGDDVEFQPVGRKETDWEKWIFAVALPNVEKALRQNVDGVRSSLEATFSGIDES